MFAIGMVLTSYCGHMSDHFNKQKQNKILLLAYILRNSSNKLNHACIVHDLFFSSEGQCFVQSESTPVIYFLLCLEAALGDNSHLSLMLISFGRENGQV